MRHTQIALALSLALTITGVVSTGAQAEDIDLFMGSNTTTATNPNVLIIMDTASSNNANITNPCGATQKTISMEQCTLVNLLNSTAVTSGINIGLAVFNPSAGGTAKGAHILSAVRPMDSTNKATLVSKVNAISTTNNAPYAKSMHEAYLYFSGGVPYAGTSGTAPYDSAAVSGGRYVSPATDSCQRNYVIYIGNGGPDSSEDGDSQTLLTGLGGKLNSDPIPLTPNNYQSNWQDEYARFMYKKDFSSLSGNQNIITYTVDVYDPTANQTAPVMAAHALLKSTASQGGGKYFAATDYASLMQALKDILVEVQSVNSVFAAVTLPVSVNVRGTYLNQVYMGVFRPDADAYPRWVGNLKEYQLKFNSANNTLYMADALGNTVANNASGFVSPNAVSYWTNSSTFWSFSPSGVGADSDSPDGDVVEKGAAAQWLRTTFATSQAARKLYTCTGTCASGSSLSATPFATSNVNITQANTGTSGASEPANLINWVRGQDLADENANGSTTDVRASIHGDVLHSRPAVVNYNRHGDSDDIFIYYGGNDGVIHAIQGGQIQSTGSPSSRRGGTEQWGFIPSEFFGGLKRLRDNNVNIVSPNPGKPYFADGPVGVYQLDANSDGKLEAGDNDKVHLYVAMRRGGRLLYALNASDPTDPKFLWKKSNASSGYSELGQTWSEPKPVKVRAFSNPVLIMGAGYSPTQDSEPPTADTMGRGVMVIDATNGDLLWQAGPSPTGATTNKTVTGMTYSIPADMTILDRDGDSLYDRVYAADTGGNIWRLDIDDANPSNWTVNKLAALGGSGSSARKFLYAPDVVYGDASNPAQPFDAVLIGSGDREHPFSTTVSDRYYMIKDPNMGKSVVSGFTAITETDLYNATSNLIQVGTTAEKATATADLGNAKGWYVALGTGEKVVGGSITLSGTVFFGTNQPAAATPGVCTNLGTARLYALSFKDASSTLDNDGVSGLTTADRSVTVPGGGFPPSPVPVVTIIDGKPGQTVCSGSNCLAPPSETLGSRRRVYWHHQIDK